MVRNLVNWGNSKGLIISCMGSLQAIERLKALCEKRNKNGKGHIVRHVENG